MCLFLKKPQYGGTSIPMCTSGEKMLVTAWLPPMAMRKAPDAAFVLYPQMTALQDRAFQLRRRALLRLAFRKGRDATCRKNSIEVFDHAISPEPPSLARPTWRATVGAGEWRQSPWWARAPHRLAREYPLKCTAGNSELNSLLQAIA
jgi:hypothetical protein